MLDKSIILFDLDGTLTDPKVGITKSVVYSLRGFGIDVENADDLIKFIGPPLRESYKKYYGLNAEQTEIAVGKYREYYSKRGIFENTLYLGIENMLQKLCRKGKRLIVATSKPTVYAQKILTHFGLAGYFEFVAGSELDGTRDDKGEIIRYALESRGIVELNDVIMIGDREHDIIGARKNSIESAGVLYGYGSRRELVDAGASYIAGSVGELSELI